MGAIKNYFKSEFQTNKFKLECQNISQFYSGCLQNKTLHLALLFIRFILFIGSVAIVVASIVLTAEGGAGKHWPIYLTHWGIVVLAIATGFGFLVSVLTYFVAPNDEIILPWYIKAYWVSYNVAAPLAVFITVFYWVLLVGLVNTEDGENPFAINEVLDIFIHAINSVVILALLLTARQPMYILHVYFVIVFALIYLLFSVIYYAAGGTDASGNPFVYPMLDWSKPGEAILTGFFSAIVIMIIHVLICLLVVARDALYDCLFDGKTGKIIIN